MSGRFKYPHAYNANTLTLKTTIAELLLKHNDKIIRTRTNTRDLLHSEFPTLLSDEPITYTHTTRTHNSTTARDPQGRLCVCVCRASLQFVHTRRSLAIERFDNDIIIIYYDEYCRYII